jgi:cysteine desulfurase
MGKAAELALSHLTEESGQIGKLRDQLEASLLASCSGAVINGVRASRLSNTTNISFALVDGEGVLVLLDEYGICASTGSACTAGSTEPSHVLRAMGVPADMLQGTVRFSLSRYNTSAEVAFVGEKVPAIIARLRGLSALGRSRKPGSERPGGLRTALH